MQIEIKHLNAKGFTNYQIATDFESKEDFEDVVRETSPHAEIKWLGSNKVFVKEVQGA